MDTTKALSALNRLFFATGAFEEFERAELSSGWDDSDEPAKWLDLATT
jgi:hypothetical protein